jgi:hypothetical protein
MTYQFGSGRFTLGLLGILGTAGAADQSPLTTSMIAPALVSLALGAWGVSRMTNGPHLPLLLRVWEARVSGRARRHRLIYQRAEGRRA